MRESLEVIIKNLLFQITNQFRKKDMDEPNVNKKEPPKNQKLPKSNFASKEFMPHSSARDSDTSWGESDVQRDHRNRLFAIGEQSESGTHKEESTPAH